jgi:sugar-specific transcriptional regulator TrmB
LGSLYSAERRKIQEGAVKAQEEAQARLERLQDAYSTLIKSFPTKAGSESAVRDRVWVLQTRENIESTLIDFIKESKSEVLRITKPPELSRGEPLDPFYIVGMENRRYLYDALERKVGMRWLSLAREIPTFSGLEVGEPPERRYLEDERDITEKFLLVDNHSLLLNLHDPVTSTYGSVALAIQSRAAASIFLDHFEKVWEKGKPLDEILPRMKQLVKDVSTKLREIGFGKIDAMFYQTLAKLGAVSRETVISELTKKRVSSLDSASSYDRLMRLGLVRRDNTYRLLVSEHPSVVGAAIASGKLRPPQSGRITTR